ncbi:MAG: DUF126 domain-containing protein [Candidatus Thermoplasmatota archaeon]|nr:DUF126 domain-containing protein [Candidatus Thermoplasmatota archaeon]
MDADISGVGLRGISDSWVDGEVLRLDGAISFLGDADPETGMVTFKGEGHQVRDRILAFREGKGSTVGSYVIYNMKLQNNSPAAMVMLVSDAIITMGCIAAGIPLVHRLREGDFDRLKDGMRVRVNSGRGLIRIIEQEM